jgi:uncharacterized membrane protein
MSKEEEIESVETSNWKVRLANRLLAEKDEKTSDMILQRLMRINIILTFLSLCFIAGDATAAQVADSVFSLI